MKKFAISIFVLASMLILTFTMVAQDSKPRASLQASTMQRIGTDTDITIGYHRPGVKSRKIWGELVPYGMAPGNKWSKNNPFPWRAGANENTTIEFSKAVLIEGKELAAGKYGIHMVPSEKDWVIIFSKNSSSWGSFAYSEEEDALRVTVTPVEAAHQEWLIYGFENLAGTSATAYLAWEKLKVSFKIQITD